MIELSHPCPKCGAARATLVLEFRDWRGLFKLLNCLSCLYQWWHPSNP